ncbi:hypothetical protein [Macrococcus armenti]|uniref:DUF5067 domain-containing protein n=1 Tax=Macrococcus armenti TaxID=2875764 RepID=A0ABY3ZX22_9STAP|nr:hypothetical protein [Macrococcus armenti]UOB21469.1 hypothetical protein MRZ06_05145 [Macrococcus armenti]
MNKLVVIGVSLSLLLAGCKGDQAENNNQDTVKQQSNLQDNNELNYVNDPIEFIKNKNAEYVDDELGYSYKIEKIFKNEQTDKDGFNKINNNKFVSNLAFVLLKEKNNDKYMLGYFGENQNNTDKHIHFLGDIEFTTDTGEQIKPESGALATSNKLIKEYNPGVKSKGLGVVALDYQDQLPKTIQVKIAQPQNNDDTNYWGQDITLNLK